jgi:hypothetical protein
VTSIWPDGAEQRPAIIAVHGAAGRLVYAKSISLAAHGYAVFSIDYRLTRDMASHAIRGFPAGTEASKLLCAARYRSLCPHFCMRDPVEEANSFLGFSRLLRFLADRL